MRLRLFLNIFLVICIISFASISVASTMSDILKSGEIRVAVQSSGPPISFMDIHGERTGLAIEFVRMMAKDMGVKLMIIDLEWKGLIPAILSGKADLIAADMTPTAKRSMRLTFTNPIFYTENIAFTMKDSPYKSWMELNKEGVRMGATQASTYGDAVKNFMPKAQLKEYGSTGQTVQAMIAGRIDGGVTDTGTVKQFLKANPGMVVLDGALAKEPLAFATRPESVHLMATLNNYIRLVTHDGRLKKVIDYWWNTSDWEKDHK